MYQETLLRIAETEAGGTIIKSLPDYFFMTLRNVITDTHRHNQRVKCVSVFSCQPTPSAPTQDEADEFLQMLDRPAPTTRQYYKQTVVKETLRIGSITKAARKLGISRGSIYHCINSLKEQLMENTEK